MQPLQALQALHLLLHLQRRSREVKLRSCQCHWLTVLAGVLC